MSVYKKRNGLDWPAEHPDVFIDLACAKHWKRLPGLTGHPADHLLRACRSLYTPTEFAIHKWTEQHALDWTETDFCITWGCAASSKSNDYGCFVVLDWVCDPQDTMCFVGSTTKEALKSRTWESILRYHHLLNDGFRGGMKWPGHHKLSGYSIVNVVEEGEDSVGEKSGIFGRALDDGGKLAGAHMPFVRVLVDELSTLKTEGAKRALDESLSNLPIGTKSFKFVGLCNPEQLYDLSAHYSVPTADGGWSSINPDTAEVWQSKWGRVRRHDGLKSPACMEPDGETKYPFLIGPTKIKELELRFGKDDVNFWRMVRGFPPMQGSAATVLEDIDISAGRACEEWERVDPGSPFFGVVRVGALDAAFTQGGDSAILVGMDIIEKDGVPLLCFHPPERLVVSASADIPVVYQLVASTREWLSKNSVDVEAFASDDSGTQSVCDVITKEIGPGIFRMNYSTKASDTPMNNTTSEPAKKRVRNLITEAWGVLAEFVKAGQVRGLSEAAAQQLTSRQYRTFKDVVMEPRMLEPKLQYKQRTKLGSPDEGDASAMAALLAHLRFGIMPGAKTYPERLAMAAAALNRMEKEQQMEMDDIKNAIEGGGSDDPLAALSAYGTP